MSHDPYRDGRNAQTNNQPIPKQATPEDQKKAEAGWWRAKEGKS